MDHAFVDILVALIFGMICWVLAFLIWSKRIGSRHSENYLNFYRMSEDQVDGANRLATIFLFGLGTLPSAVVVGRFFGYAEEALIVALIAILVGGVTVYRMFPPKEGAERPPGRFGFLTRNRPRMASSAILISQLISVPYLYSQGVPVDFLFLSTLAMLAVGGFLFAISFY
jgi:hypothetical protein